MASNPFLWLYSLLQWFLAKIFSPYPPAPGARLRRPKIAIIGAGLTGVSAASHCVGHGFDVVLFEAGGREHLGGIWTVSHCLLPSKHLAYLFCDSMRNVEGDYADRLTGCEQHFGPPDS